MGTLILLLAIQLGLTSESNGIIATLPNLRALTWTAPYLFAPLTYLYIRSILTREPLQWKHITHFILFLISLIGLLPYFQLEHSAKVNFDISSDSYFLTFAISFEALRVLQAVFYSVMIFGLIRKFKTAAQGEVSNIPLKWVYQFVYASLSSWIVAFLGILAYFTAIDLAINPFNFVYLLTLIFIYMLGFKMLSNPLIFGFTLSLAEKSVNSKTRYTKSGLKSDVQSVYLDTLSKLMETGQPHLESNITINGLAERLDIPKHHLSQLINEQLNQNFFDFINNHRVEHAKKLLLDSSNDHLKILAIAYDSGFNSKSTFNSLFKKYTGQTPSKFRETFRQTL